MSAPKCTSWLGHKFEPRFDYSPPSSFKTEGAEDAGMVALIIESARRKTYVQDVCVRCGCVVNRPPTQEQTKP